MQLRSKCKGFLACIGHVQSRIRDDGLEEERMLFGQRDKRSERITGWDIVENEVRAHISRN